MDTLTRWTGISALVVSSFSLGMSGWVVGCRGNEAATSHDTPAATTPTESPRPVAVQTAVPIAAGTTSVQPATPPAPSTTAAPDARANAKASRPASKQATAAGALRVKRLVVTRKVEAREPVDTKDTFALDGAPLYAFVEMENRTADASQIVITFEKPGTSAGHIELGVPANQARWRTWGMTRGIKDTGDWDVVVRTTEGAELARTSFAVTKGT